MSIEGLDPNRLLTAGTQLLILLLAVSLHESAHAWMAARCGDPTAAMLGRVTLNPLRHLDPIGSVLLPLFLALFGMPIFGWAKPTPLLVRNLRRPRRDSILVSAAGPLSNLLLAALAALALAVAIQVLGPQARESASMALQLSLVRGSPALAGLPHFPLLFTLVQMAYLNGFLAVFNLVPIPPLDGGHIVLDLMPPDWAQRYGAVRPYGFMIVMALGLLGVLTLLSSPVLLTLWLIIHL